MEHLHPNVRHRVYSQANGGSIVNIMKSAESVASPAILGIAVGIAGTVLLWPKVGGAVYGALSGSMGSKPAALVADGVGAVGAQVIKGFLPGPWKIAGDVMSGILVYDAAQTFVPNQLPALAGGAA